MAFSRRRTRRRRRSLKGGKKAKLGAKSNPFPSKKRAMKSRRKGKVFFKKKGRKYSMKKK